MSFYSIPPENQSVESVFGQLGSNASTIFTEDQVAVQLPNGNWVGSLQEVEADDGYWLRLNESANFTVYGLPTGVVQYSVHLGNNLLSYSYDVPNSVADALPDDIEGNILGIFGENVAAFNNNGMWFGSMNSFEPGKGYWVVSSDAFQFEYNVPSGTSFVRSNELPELPTEFEYYQSTSQAFYFVDEIVLSHFNLDDGDIVLAYNNSTIVGARQWGGQYTDVPVMGYDESDENTYDYCQPGDMPKFVLYKINTGEMIDLIGNDIPEFNHNQIYVVGALNDVLFPDDISLLSPYPNPFNPSTTIEYEVPFGGSHINISIFDIRGRLVEELVDEFKESSIVPYKLHWNAREMSSGVYFVKMSSGSNVKTQKIMLIK